MSIKSKVLAAGAVLTVTAGLAGPVSWTAARAATPSCGPTCADIFSKNFGTYHNPQFTFDVFQQGAKVGQPIILFRESNADPAEDFTISEEGQVSDFFQAGLVSAAFNLHYGCNYSIAEAKCTNSFPDEYAFEIQYAPYGVDSGLCVGATSAVPGTKVTLQGCGVSAATVWAADTLDSCLSNPLYSLEVQAINGLDVNFSHPSVLTYPAAGYPTDKPRPQLYLSSLAGFSQTGGTGSSAVCGGLAVIGPDNNQLWGARAGVLP
jgi:hypothetical protein